MKKTILFMLLSLIMLGACTEEPEFMLPAQGDETQSVDTVASPNFAKKMEDSTALICKEIIESPDFIKLKTQLGLMAQKLMPDNLESSEIALWNDRDKLYAWLNKNRHKTGYKDTAEFSKAFQEIESTSRLLNQKYAVFFESEDNKRYFREFTEDYIFKENPGESTQPLTTDCLVTLIRCTETAQEEYDIQYSIGLALAIFNPVVGIAYASMALRQYNRDVNACLKSYANCDTP
ncbi:MAG: hypothetical protein LBD91_06155 [Prevotellaceae bacterium]|jgi:hypothetical protein|nr:hypothetical protein [Prevotellaceae bacterium]